MPEAPIHAEAPAIRAEALTKRFDSVTAVDAVDFVVPRGSITALLGGNGAGKTTTIAMVLGLLVPTSGTITVLGHDMATDRHGALKRMNFSSPYIDMPHRLSAIQNLRVYANLYNVADPRRRVAEIVEDLGIGDFAKRPSGKLSAGQKTRVALAKALINRPDVLLLDEPTASLDPDTADWVRGYFESYQRGAGATIFLASHNMGEVERLCDQVLMLKAGRIVDRGTPAELIGRYGRRNLEEVFLDIARNRSRDNFPTVAQ